MPIRTSKEGRDRYAEIQLAMWFENVRNAEIQLSKDVLQEIQKLRNSGVSPANIVKSFMDRIDRGEGFEKHFLNDSAYELWKDMKAITQHEVYSSMDDGDYYKWEYNPSAKHCEICEELNGKIKTFQEWEAEGLPGHRNEGCYANCCCDLVKVERKEKGKKKDSYEMQKEDGNKDNNKESNNVDSTEKLSAKAQEYIDLLKKDFKIDFDNIEELSEENLQELHTILDYIQNKFGTEVLDKNRYDGLTKIAVAGKEIFDDDVVACFQSGDRAIYLNRLFYSKDVEQRIKYGVNGLKISIPHEFGHYIAKKLGVTNKVYYNMGDVDNFYDENKKYLEDRFPFLLSYKGDKQRKMEFLVEMLGCHYAGVLDNKDKNDEQNTKLVVFATRKWNELAELQRSD